MKRMAMGLILILLAALCLPASAQDFALSRDDLPPVAPIQSGSTIERVEYETFAYSRNGTPGKAGTNEAYVYLPAGYDPTSAYDILYLMHGGGEHAGYWLAQGEYAQGGSRDISDTSITKDLLDSLIKTGVIDPIIVVTPCIEADVKRRGMNDEGLFRHEFKKDLMPFIESRYATYARGDVSPEGLIASRAHRAFAGLSLGSAAGWSSILYDCTDVVGYVGTFSGCYANMYAVAESLNTAYRDYPILYWYNGNGTNDASLKEHQRAYDYVLKTCGGKLQESAADTPGNCCFVTKPGMGHNYDSWITDLYNALRVFFPAE